MKVFQAAKEYNVSVESIIEHLNKKGYKDVTSMTSRLTPEMLDDCASFFQKDKAAAERQSQKLKEITVSRQKDVPEPKHPEPVTKKVEPAKPVSAPVAPVIVPEPEPEPVPEPIAVQPEPEPVPEPEPEPEPIAVVPEPEPVVAPEPDVPAKEPEPVAEVAETVVVSDLAVKPVEETAAETEQAAVAAAAAETRRADEEKSGYKSHQQLGRMKLTGPNVVGKIDLAAVNEFKKRPRKKGRADEAPAASEAGSGGGQQNRGPRPQRPDGPRPDGQRNDPNRPPRPPRPGEARPAAQPGFAPADPSKKPAVKGKDHKPKEGEATTDNRELGKKKKIKKGKVVDISVEDVNRAIRTTLATMEDTGPNVRKSIKKQKRRDREAAEVEKQEEIIRNSSIIRVTDFASANELAGLMSVPVNQVLSKCLELGLFVSINQRLEKDHIELIAGDFGFQVQFQEEFAEDIYDSVEDDPALLKARPPVVTIMGHVDHGKTSLLDYIRKANVVAGEAGGITQHIGAYSVKMPDDRMITFLDTPGHEAFTAMRARGAKVTDVVIIVIAADDSVMPQTVEAINHAQAAGVPMVFAINKIDKPGANTERIYQQLSERNILVEEWGGKYQVAKVSAKSGIGVPELLEKVLLEAEILDLKANPDRNAQGTVVEAELDKGKGTIATILVQNGTLRVGDIFLCGATYGRIRALQDERGKKLKAAGPATPAQVLGFDEVPQAGDVLLVMDSEKEAREIATRRMVLKREQEQRKAQKHMSLDMISQRMSEGSVRDLNIIVKGDVDGSVEALSDSLMKLSNPEVRVRVIHKAVGPITESDVLLAAASDAVIIGFQVRPNLNAKKLAQTEEIDIRLYSIIYDAINEVKAALEGMLSPDISEEVTATIEVRETFRISRVGTIAGCYVQDGKVTRGSKVRVVRDGIVVYTGELDSLKRFKDDVKEVEKGYECGLSVRNFNDIKTGDIIESFHLIETKRKLVN